MQKTIRWSVISNGGDLSVLLTEAMCISAACGAGLVFLCSRAFLVAFGAAFLCLDFFSVMVGYYSTKMSVCEEVLGISDFR